MPIHATSLMTTSRASAEVAAISAARADVRNPLTSATTSNPLRRQAPASHVIRFIAHLPSHLAFCAYCVLHTDCRRQRQSSR